MQASQAQTPTMFRRYNEESADAVSAHFASCGCRPYMDVFTVRRWNDQGYAIQRGQHGFKLGAKTVVFCRHQVVAIATAQQERAA